MFYFYFLIPISDMSNVIFKRIREGKSPFFPDRSHLHHKLIDAHFSENNVLLILSASSIFLYL